MDTTSISSIIALCANIATAVGILLLVWQVRVSGAAVKAQTRAAELQIYADLNLKFLEIVSHFGEHINKPGLKEEELTAEERRALDRWFYLASMEYAVYNRRLMDDALLSDWVRGIQSAAQKPIFVERFRSTASNFRLDPGFRKIFEDAAGRPPSA
ncbi:hypothetical protein ACVME8_001926 [Bradyrhizobium diazoefficiens]